MEKSEILNDLAAAFRWTAKLNMHEGMRKKNIPTINTKGLRIKELYDLNSKEFNLKEEEGISSRIKKI